MVSVIKGLQLYQIFFLADYILLFKDQLGLLFFLNCNVSTFTFWLKFLIVALNCLLPLCLFLHLFVFKSLWIK